MHYSFGCVTDQARNTGGLVARTRDRTRPAGLEVEEVVKMATSSRDLVEEVVEMATSSRNLETTARSGRGGHHDTEE